MDPSFELQAIASTPTPVTPPAATAASIAAEFFMTSEQHRVISELLPKGFSLQFAPKPIRQKSCSFTKTPSTSSIRSTGAAPTGAPLSQFSTPTGLPFRSQSIQSYPNSSNNTTASPHDQLADDLNNNNNNNNNMSIYSQQNSNYPVEPSNLHLSNDNLTFQNNSFSDNSNNNRRKQPKTKRAPASSARNKKRKGEQLLMPATHKQSRLSPTSSSLQQSGMSSEESKKCFNVLHALQKHKSASPFQYPVDPVHQGCPDYFTVVRDPMDLSTIELNLKQNLYQSRTQFAADIRKIWNNSYIYNPRDSHIYHLTLEMDKFFEKKFSETEQTSRHSEDVKNIPFYMKMIAQAINNQQGTGAITNNTHAYAAQHAQRQQSSAPKRSSNSTNNSTNSSRSANNNNNSSKSKKTKKAPSKMDTPMTMQEKKSLGASIMQLPHDNLRGIWEIVKTDDNQEYDGSILRFDLDTLSVRKTRELEIYVKQKTAAAAKKQSKKSLKAEEKSAGAAGISGENTKLTQHNFSMDDDTATTHHDVLNTQDMTQSTMVTQSHMLQSQHHMTSSSIHQQHQQVVQHQHHQYAAPTQSHTAHYNEQQQVKPYQAIQQQQQQQQHQQQQLLESQRHRSNNDDDADSDSSFISEDSDSQDYS